MAPGGGFASGCRHKDGCVALVAEIDSRGLRNETTARCGSLNTAFIVFGLLMLSEAISDVSMVPGGWLSSRW